MELSCQAAHFDSPEIFISDLIGEYLSLGIENYLTLPGQ